ncbi:MAG: Crp/Fnr family transcriptional regulator [Proteobacteria bacterium]|nr:Crp/Fnr family transcriptional regulator [Pseudomonadota bacterium]
MTPEQMFRQHPLFGSLDAGDRQDLLEHVRLRSLASGQVVFREGDEADGLYGVLSGRIVVTVDSPNGKELILNTFGPGSFFGEIAFLDGRGRTATAVAREASRLVFLGRAAFLPFLRERPAAAIRMIAFLCERLRRTTQLVQDSAFLDVPTRLAKQMAVMAQDYGERGASETTLTIAVSQAELAHMLGVSREVVSRQLALWRHAGAIDIGRGRIVVHDASFFDRIVAGG